MLGLACVLSRFSRVWLFVTLWTAAHQAPLSMGILWARILMWVAMTSSRGSSWPRDQIWVSYSLLHWQAGSLPLMPPAKPLCVESGRKKKVRQITWKAVQHWGCFLECKCHSWANSLSFHDLSVSWASSRKESDTTEQFSLSLFFHFHYIDYSGTVSLFQAQGVQKQVCKQPWDSWCDCASQASLVAQMVKNLPIMRENQVQSLGQKDALEKGVAAHSRIPAQRIPWTEEPGEL